MVLDFLLFQKLIVSLLLGALIGLEREHTRHEEKFGIRFAGIRTFALFGFFGAVAQIFFGEQEVFLWLLTAGILLLIVAGYVITSLTTKTAGATTELAAIGVYLIGFVVGRGEFLAATALALLVLIILHFKNPLHHFAYRISKEELTSTVKFMILAFIILPLLPNIPYGPLSVFNPYLIWLMVVFISGISFASYLAMKFLGKKKGIGIMGFLGGFVSSTALTLSFSHESKKHPDLVNPYVFAITIASSAMFFRMLVEMAVLNQNLFQKLLIPLALMGITGAILSIFFWRRKEATSTSAEHQLTSHAQKLESPFTIKPALKFAFVFAIILFISKAASLSFGDRGIYITSFLSGILDVDAITVSLANLAKVDLSETVASRAIFIAAVMNTVSKGILFTMFGNGKVAKNLWLVFGGMIVVGLLALFLVSGVV